MNQLEKREYYEEDEIDIYELVDIIIKRKILVLAIFIICSLLGLGAAFFVRSLKQDTLALKFNTTMLNLKIIISLQNLV